MGACCSRRTPTPTTTTIIHQAALPQVQVDNLANLNLDPPRQRRVCRFPQFIVTRPIPRQQISRSFDTFSTRNFDGVNFLNKVNHPNQLISQRQKEVLQSLSDQTATTTEIQENLVAFQRI